MKAISALPVGQSSCRQRSPPQVTRSPREDQQQDNAIGAELAALFKSVIVSRTGVAQQAPSALRYSNSGSGTFAPLEPIRKMQESVVSRATPAPTCLIGDARVSPRQLPPRSCVPLSPREWSHLEPSTSSPSPAAPRKVVPTRHSGAGVPSPLVGRRSGPPSPPLRRERAILQTGQPYGLDDFARSVQELPQWPSIAAFRAPRPISGSTSLPKPALISAEALAQVVSAATRAAQAAIAVAEAASSQTPRLRLAQPRFSPSRPESVPPLQFPAAHGPSGSLPSPVFEDAHPVGLAGSGTAGCRCVCP
ncbi:unnamed protein product, partial [Polarella glacialis]